MASAITDTNVLQRGKGLSSRRSELDSWTKPYLARDVRGKDRHLSPTEAAAGIADRKGVTSLGFVRKSA